MTTEGNPLQNARVAYEYYELPGELVDIQPLGNGLINKTYQITHTHKMQKNNMYYKPLTMIFFQTYVD